jgi:hypothetical protein
MHARQVEPDGALRGVTCGDCPDGEPETSGGIEGSSWDMPIFHFPARYLVSLLEIGPQSFALISVLPPALRRLGTSHTIVTDLRAQRHLAHSAAREGEPVQLHWCGQWLRAAVVSVAS